MKRLTLLVIVLGILINPLMGADYLAYATGEEVISELIFINPTENSIQILVDFYDQGKAPVDVSLKEHGEFNSFWVCLAPWEVWKCQTEEGFELQSGYVKADFLYEKGIVLVNIKHKGIRLSEQMKQAEVSPEMKRLKGD